MIPWRLVLNNIMYQTQFQNLFSPTLMVRRILIATVAAYAAQVFFALFNVNLSIWFGLGWDGMKSLMLWQPVTYLFMHDLSPFHILLNLIGLFFFGPETERALGSRKFLVLYLGCGILGGLGWLLLAGNHDLCIGASGAVFGVLGAFVGLHPDRPITLLVFFVLPVTLRARTMAIGLGLMNLLLIAFGNGSVAYAAHLAGGLAGYLYTTFVYRHSLNIRALSPVTWVNNLLWHWHRRKFKVLSQADSAAFRSEAEPDENDVNRILDKISRQGMASLTPEELEILQNAHRHRNR